MMKVKIGDNVFDVDVAEDDNSRSQGLRGVPKLKKGQGLVLKYDSPRMVPISMQGMKIPLSLVFMRGGRVQQIRDAQPGQQDINIYEPVDQVLEVNKGEARKLRMGDQVEWIGSKDEGGNIAFKEGEAAAAGDLHVLDDEGKIQTNLQGNERVFSRIHTKQLVDLSTQAGATLDVKDFRKLGRAMVRMINKQDTQKPEYVEE